MLRKIRLPINVIEFLLEYPESGMGYQVVDIILSNGQILKDRQVINSTYLILLENEYFTTHEIKAVDIHEKQV
ncbi:hypothetical protein [Bacteroides graminisolvens]